jgi:hypothetical protein
MDIKQVGWEGVEWFDLTQDGGSGGLLCSR